LAATGLIDRIKGAGQWLRSTTAADVSTAAGRCKAWWHFQLVDHAYLRTLWSNWDQVAPGVYRSNQPGARRIAALAAQGIKTLVSLRGSQPTSFNLLEAEACRRTGVTLVSHRLSSAQLPPRAELLALYQTFLTAEKPFVIHCKSGADRSGLAAALYQILVVGAPVTVAARQLHWRYLHFKGGPRGVLDYMLTVYAQAQAETGISMADWIATTYDPVALTRAFKSGKR
jgi:protein tyrosine/serine phosphatase